MILIHFGTLCLKQPLLHEIFRYPKTLLFFHVSVLLFSAFRWQNIRKQFSNGSTKSGQIYSIKHIMPLTLISIKSSIVFFTSNYKVLISIKIIKRFCYTNLCYIRCEIIEWFHVTIVPRTGKIWNFLQMFYTSDL